MKFNKENAIAFAVVGYFITMVAALVRLLTLSPSMTDRESEVFVIAYIGAAWSVIWYNLCIREKP
jgi:hypothetical protein